MSLRSRCLNVTLWSRGCVIRLCVQNAKLLFTMIVYLFYPTNCYRTLRIVFAFYLLLRAIQKLALKIYSVSTTSTNLLVWTSHLPVPVRHSSADSLSSGSRCVWDSSSSNIIKLTTSLSKENRDVSKKLQTMHNCDI